ncbi:MAG: hypothetical protein IPJ88_18785 [Myxococcales bacterium]|nr:MAG: hypothetical protein IPJ88_18785 [Myxococcales bacterium]
MSLRQIRQANARYRHEPSAAEVVSDAIRYARLGPKYLDKVRSRARDAGWVPTLRLGASRVMARDLSEQQSLSTDKTNLSTDNDLRLEALLVFDFSRFVFSSHEVTVLSQERIRNDARHDLVQSITKAYYERRQLQIERDVFGKQDLQQMMRIRELGDYLHAMTGGKFYRSP